MFLIRENAIKILVDIYKDCNSELKVNINAKNFDSMIDDNFLKSLNYLESAGYIKIHSLNENKNVELTALGIDKAEDFILSQQE